MRLDELPPGRVLAPLGCRLDAVPLQDVADRLVTHVVTQIGERSHDPIISPARVLHGHPNNSSLDLRPDSRTAGIGAVSGTVEFAGDQPPVPGQDCVGLGHAGYLCQRLASESLTDLGQSGPLRIGSRSRAGRCARRIWFSAARYSTRRVNVCQKAQLLVVFIPSVHNSLHHQCFGFLTIRAVREKALDGTYLLPEYSNGGRQGDGVCLD